MFFKCEDDKAADELYSRLCVYFKEDKDLLILLKEARDHFCFFYEEAKKEFERRGGTDQRIFVEVEGDVFSPSPLLDLINEIRHYASTHEKFEDVYLLYVDSIIEFFEEKKYVTKAQYNDLVRIYYGFKMEEQ